MNKDLQNEVQFLKGLSSSFEKPALATVTVWASDDDFATEGQAPPYKGGWWYWRRKQDNSAYKVKFLQQDILEVHAERYRIRPNAPVIEYLKPILREERFVYSISMSSSTTTSSFKW